MRAYYRTLHPLEPSSTDHAAAASTMDWAEVWQRSVEPVNPPDTVDGKYSIFRVGRETAFKYYRANLTRLEPDSTEPGHDMIFPRDETEALGRVVRVIISNP